MELIQNGNSLPAKDMGCGTDGHKDASSLIGSLQSLMHYIFGNILSKKVCV